MLMATSRAEGTAALLGLLWRAGPPSRRICGSGRVLDEAAHGLHLGVVVPEGRGRLIDELRCFRSPAGAADGEQGRQSDERRRPIGLHDQLRAERADGMTG